MDLGLVDVEWLMLMLRVAGCGGPCWRRCPGFGSSRCSRCGG